MNIFFQQFLSDIMSIYVTHAIMLQTLNITVSPTSSGQGFYNLLYTGLSFAFLQSIYSIPRLSVGNLNRADSLILHLYNFHKILTSHTSILYNKQFKSNYQHAY